MNEKFKANLWLLFNLVAITYGSVDRVIQEKYTVEKNSNIPSKENLIANVSAESKLRCALWCTAKDNCCSSTYDKTKGICGLYSCCSPITTAALYQDVLKKQPTQGCNGLQNKCPVSQGYTYNATVCLCLKYIATKLNHDAAVAACAADNGELVKIESSCQQRHVESFLKATIPGETSNYVWIQGDKFSGVYIFDDGTELTYYNWDTSEPEAVGTEQPYLFIKISTAYKWHAAQTYYSIPALCQVF